MDPKATHTKKEEGNSEAFPGVSEKIQARWQHSSVCCLLAVDFGAEKVGKKCPKTHRLKCHTHPPGHPTHHAINRSILCSVTERTPGPGGVCCAPTCWTWKHIEQRASEGELRPGTAISPVKVQSIKIYDLSYTHTHTHTHACKPKDV